ncbi:MAG: glycerophosphoryl diester phosphodiesterase [Alcanivorax sp.]
MSLKLPRIIGHRGAAEYAPENTLVSIHTAADMGIKWVELDVKLTKDDVPIIFHDDTLDRTTDSSGLVAEKTYQELKELDCGIWHGESFLGTHIPTLEEAIEVLIDRDLGLNLEIKPCPSREKETAEVALDLLSTIWDDHDRLIISSFQHVSLETAQDMASDWHRGLLLPEEWPENWQELAQYLQVSTVHVNANHVSREQIEEIMDIEKPILAYTVNEADTARRLQSWGVDGFFSDRPDALLEGIFSVH